MKCINSDMSVIYIIVLLLLSFQSMGCSENDDIFPSEEGESDLDTDSENSNGGDTENQSDGETEGAIDPSLSDWVFIEGGSFEMGDWTAPGVERELPLHTVDIPDFYMWRTEVTKGQYRDCVNKGYCTVPEKTGGFCNYDNPERDDTYAANCITWYQARAFCHFAGGRLPSESEWEYTARSRGKNKRYPWGDEEPNCDLAIIDTAEGAGCGERETWPVCSKPAGNTEQGLCDMAGNNYEWLEDWYHSSYLWEYEGVTYVAPDDGSAWLEQPSPGDFKVMRGGGLNSADEYYTTLRVFHPPDWTYGALGVRCAKH